MHILIHEVNYSYPNTTTPAGLAASPRPPQTATRMHGNPPMKWNNPNQLFAKLRLQLPALAKAEQRAAEYILDHPDEMHRLNLQDIAENSGLLFVVKLSILIL